MICSDFFQGMEIKNYYNIIDMPADSFPVKVENGMGYFANNVYHMMRKDNSLIFARDAITKYYTSTSGYVCILEVPLEEILYYKCEGSLRYEQQISGGGGMGINYGGAVIGGLLFGSAGATIGSRKNEEIQKVESKTITHDTRIVMLVMRKKDMIYKISFDINAECAFDWLIPDKQYDYVIQKRREMYENI
jgi:hypothetical protein